MTPTRLHRAVEIAVLLLAVVSPWSITAAEIALGVALLCCLVGWATRRVPWPSSALHRPLALFAGVWTVAAMVGYHSVSRGLAQATHEWIVLAAPVVAVGLARPVQRARAAVCLLASESLLGMYSLYQHLTGRDPLLGRAIEKLDAGGYLATGTFSHHLTLAGHAMLATTVAIAVAVGATRARHRAWAVLACIGCGNALLWSYGRSAWIGVLVAAPFAVLGVDRVRRRVVWGMMSALLATLVLVPPLRARLVHVMSDDVIGPRVRLWKTALRIIQAHPILGVGPGGWHAAFVQYHVPGFYWSDAHAHNDVLAVAANAGVLGLAAFAWMWATALRTTIGAARARRGGVLVLAGVLASVAVLSGGQFQCFQTDAEVAILLWAIVGAACAAAPELRAP